MFLEGSAGFLRLLSAAVGQVNIRPTSEEILLVPVALPVSQEN
jgi:hypothetical protein